MGADQLAVIVVEDDAAAQAGIALLLRAERLRVMGLVGDSGVARVLLGCPRYVVAVLDVHLGANSALGLAEHLPRRRPPSCELYSGDIGADVVLAESIRLGARGFVVTCSERLISPRPSSTERDSVDCAFVRSSIRSAVATQHTRLDPGEYDVLGLLASGLDRRAVGERLSLTPEVVHARVRTGAAKLSATTRIQAVGALIRCRDDDALPVFV
jgi:DNA-binding NarL/FixJ family response regulator